MRRTEVTVRERAHDFGRLADLVDPERNLVARLGIVGVDINDENAQWAPALREASGVMVVGRAQEHDVIDSGLMMGDTIHRINATAVSSVDDLRTAIDNLKPRSAVVLQIERNGQLSLLAFELD